MKISAYREAYYESSATASEVGRQAAYAGIAVVWIFSSNNQLETIPRELLIPSLLFVMSLGFDLLQYVVKSAIWSYFARYYEKKDGVETDKDYSVHWSINYPTLIMFWGKLSVLVVGYILLAIYIFKVWV